jgi:hypothetical protein
MRDDLDEQIDLQTTEFIDQFLVPSLVEEMEVTPRNDEQEAA